MAIKYRKLTVDDISVFIQLRIDQLREEGATEVIDLSVALYSYYIKHLKDETFISWLAFDGEQIIATSGLSIVEKPPYFSSPTGTIGLLSSMYTVPNYRRKGIAKELLSKLVNEAKKQSCGYVQITASEMGIKLYSTYGFELCENFLQYKID